MTDGWPAGPRGSAGPSAGEHRLHLLTIKIVLALVLLLSGTVAALSMLSLLGRAEPPANPGRVRAVHRVAGYIFAAALVALAAAGLRILASSGDGLPVRGVLHWATGALLVVVAAVKIVTVRFYKKFLRAAPGLGTAVLVLALLAAALSVVFAFVAWGPPSTWQEQFRWELPGASTEPGVEGVAVVVDAGPGRMIFRANCARCHGPEATGIRKLTGLFDRERLVSSRLPVTRENVLSQIVDPVDKMPSFKGRLSNDELAGLLDYLEGL